MIADLSAMLMRQGMMTAGDTAASTNPSISPTYSTVQYSTVQYIKVYSVQYSPTVSGKPMMKWERPATAAASTKQGMKVALGIAEMMTRITVTRLLT